MKKTKIAIIGIGAISGIYLENLTHLYQQLEIVGVCDLIRERAEKAQKEYNIPKIYDTMEAAFADVEIDIILNLTRPSEHFTVTQGALKAGKNVYSEKPLAANYDEGLQLITLAKAKGLMIGGAPDTFLGAGIQTCRKLIDDGYIGDVVGFNASMICHGHETWHPDPAFYYQTGGGPMMDMGPYYITALVNLLGEAKGVTSLTKQSFDERTITSAPFAGETIKVEVPTYVTGIISFANGAIGNLFTTFDVFHQESAKIEIYGTRGTLLVPDPNGFGDKIYLLRPEADEYKEIPLLFDYPNNSRGLGLADMAAAIQHHRPVRANMDQTFHVLEIMTAFQRSSDKQAFEPIKSNYERQAPMEKATILGVFDN